MDFSLSFWGVDDGHGTEKYRLLFEAARAFDDSNFVAMWVPERHFHPFGGNFPNPALATAALASITKRLKLRAGSVVLPLRNPILVAEDWSVLDNMSNGRVGVSFASGWAANDFALAPNAFENRRQIMYRDVEVVRKLWRGESVRLPDGLGREVDISLVPRPVQRELPVWITAAVSPETFQKAGQIGASVLTHLLGQDVVKLEQKIALYRRARQESGSAGPGHVTLLIHTFVHADVDCSSEKVTGPLREYLRSSAELTVSALPTSALGSPDATSKEDAEAVLDYAVERYFRRSGLFGSPANCVPLVRKLESIGVDEIACLIDFGVDVELVVSTFDHLKELKRLCDAGA